METSLIADFGPIYTETLTGRFPVEPFNTFSNLLFLLLVVTFMIRTQLNYRAFPVSVLALPILLTGFIGGSLYHATRAHSLWLVLDFVPIAILVLLACLYFWQRLVGSLILAALIAPVPVVLLRWVMVSLELPRTLMISGSYVMMALSILAPAFFVCMKNNFRDISLLILAAVSFTIAVFFRTNDSAPAVIAIFPMGTHFLWHIFGAVSTGFLLEFIFRDEVRSGETFAASNVALP